MASLDELVYMTDAILPYLTHPPVLPPASQHAYLLASLEFAYTAVELVEAQLERSLRAAQDGLAAALTEAEILEMERRLVEEQRKMDDMKARCRARTQRVMDEKRRERNLKPFSPSKSPAKAVAEKTKPKRRMSLSLLG